MIDLSALNEEWQQWVHISLKRGVNLNEIASELFSRGWVEAGESLLSLRGTPPLRPNINTKVNKVVLSDKIVNITQTYRDPQVVVIDDFLSEVEALALIESSKDRLTSSQVVDNNDGGSVSSDARTSDSVGYTRGYSPLIETIEARAAELLNWPVVNGEGILVLRYEVGQEYRPHYDYFDATTRGGLRLMKTGGQRVGTFLMYLSDVEAGGGTCFPTLGLEIRPKMGRAVYFANMDAFGGVDNKTLHGGMPVVEGTKYLATIWLRERAYH